MGNLSKEQLNSKEPLNSPKEQINSPKEQLNSNDQLASPTCQNDLTSKHHDISIEEHNLSKEELNSLTCQNNLTSKHHDISTVQHNPSTDKQKSQIEFTSKLYDITIEEDNRVYSPNKNSNQEYSHDNQNVASTNQDSCFNLKTNKNKNFASTNQDSCFNLKTSESNTNPTNINSTSQNMMQDSSEPKNTVTYLSTQETPLEILETLEKELVSTLEQVETMQTFTVEKAIEEVNNITNAAILALKRRKEPTEIPISLAQIVSLKVVEEVENRLNTAIKSLKGVHKITEIQNIVAEIVLIKVIDEVNIKISAALKLLQGGCKMTIPDKKLILLKNLDEVQNIVNVTLKLLKEDRELKPENMQIINLKSKIGKTESKLDNISQNNSRKRIISDLRDKSNKDTNASASLEDDQHKKDLKCRAFERFGTCKRKDSCNYIHVKHCFSFRRSGTCSKGSRCPDRHTRSDCPFWLKGICRNTNRHKCPEGNHDRLKRGSRQSPEVKKRKRTSSSGSDESTEDIKGNSGPLERDQQLMDRDSRDIMLSNRHKVLIPQISSSEKDCHYYYQRRREDTRNINTETNVPECTDIYGMEMNGGMGMSGSEENATMEERSCLRRCYNKFCNNFGHFTRNCQGKCWIYGYPKK